MFKVSLNNFNTFEELRGNQVIQTTHGYKNILNLMIDKHRQAFDSRLHLNHSLCKILICKHLKRSPNASALKHQSTKCSHCLYTKHRSQVVLLITDLSDKTKPRNLIVRCDNVVCTMSLGFLKKNLPKLIEPPSFIPTEKLLAVSRLGYGAINKVIEFNLNFQSIYLSTKECQFIGFLGIRNAFLE